MKRFIKDNWVKILFVIMYIDLIFFSFHILLVPTDEYMSKKKQNEVQLVETCGLLKSKQFYEIKIDQPNTFYVVNLEKINQNTTVGDVLLLDSIKNTIKVTNKVEINYKDGLYQINIYGTENENGEIINQDVITKSLSTTSLTIKTIDNLCNTYLNDQRSAISVDEHIKKIFNILRNCLIGINIVLVILVQVVLKYDKKER